MQDRKIADDLYEAYNQGFDNGFEQGVSVTKAEYEWLYAPVVHAKWIKEPPYTSVGGEYKKALICSECHSFFVSDGNKPWQLHKYCPNCGAKMDLEDGDSHE